MAHFTSVTFIAALMLAGSAFAATGIPSFGLQTAPSIRGELPDSAFMIDFDNVAQTDGGNFLAQGANLDNTPALAGQDVQSTVNRIRVDPGTSFPSHSHPRASETLYLQEGEVEVFFRMEGLVDPRIVRNKLHKGQATTFPQGLGHGIKCVSKKPCLYIAVLCSADPGTVIAPDA